MRVAALHLGGTAAAAGTVVATFLGGLALGSVAGGKWADRALASRPAEFGLRAYVVLELVIGAYALAVGPLLSALSGALGGLYGEAGDRSGLFLAARALVCAVVLFPPTAAMGATLPILARAAAAAAEDPARTAGKLYAVNTLGGVLGAAAAGWALLPVAGLFAATAVGAALNAAAAGLALTLRRLPAARPAEAQAAASPCPAWIFPAYAASGFAALVCEIAWTRGLVLSLGSSVFAFSLVLAAFILGLGLGGVGGARWASRTSDPLGAFAVLELAVALLAAASITFLEKLPLAMMKAVASVSSFEATLGVQAGLAAAVVSVPAACLGAMFPLLCRLAVRTPEATGAAVARLYSWNTAGSILGALAGSFVLLPWRGVPGSLRAAAAVNVAVAALAFWKRPAGGKVAAPAALALGLAAVLLVPGWDLALVSTTPVLYGERYVLDSAAAGRSLSESVRGSSEVVYHRWDALGLVTVHRSRGGSLSLRVNGKTEATDRQDMAVQLLVAHVPLLLHRDPKEVLVVGLGSGATASAPLRHPIRTLDVVELSPGVVGASALFESAVGPWSRDSRVNLFVADARTHVRFTGRRYDVIVAEPSNLWISGMGTLFTREQFERYRSRLNPGGVVAQWVHAYRLPRKDFAAVLATFRGVFPRCTLWEFTIGGDYLMLGADGEGADFGTLRRRFEAEAVSGHLRPWGIDSAESLLRSWIAGPEAVRRLSEGAREITDDFCHVEYSAPRGLVREDRAEILAALDTVRGLAAGGLEGAPDPAPGREARRFLVEAVRRAHTGSLRDAFERLREAASRDPGDPALAGASAEFSRLAFERAFAAHARGDLPGALGLLALIPESSEDAAEARGWIQFLEGRRRRQK
jgi:spermidine synthase